MVGIRPNVDPQKIPVYHDFTVISMIFQGPRGPVAKFWGCGIVVGLKKSPKTSIQWCHFEDRKKNTPAKPISSFTRNQLEGPRILRVLVVVPQNIKGRC